MDFLVDFLFDFWGQILGAIGLGALAWLARQVIRLWREHTTLVQAECYDQKLHILAIHQRVLERGYITHLELDTVTQLIENHKTLREDRTMVVIQKKIEELPVRGDSIYDLYAPSPKDPKD